MFKLERLYQAYVVVILLKITHRKGMLKSNILYCAYEMLRHNGVVDLEVGSKKCVDFECVTCRECGVRRCECLDLNWESFECMVVVIAVSYLLPLGLCRK